ncbi:hypothetical protein B9S66_30910 (plasmid) [Streptomyces sp. SM17]|nr:hypothetical protein B9S66_30910 [Streptomyces sp. SM17]
MSQPQASQPAARPASMPQPVVVIAVMSTARAVTSGELRMSLRPVPSSAATAATAPPTPTAPASSRPTLRGPAGARFGAAASRGAAAV